MELPAPLSTLNLPSSKPSLMKTKHHSHGSSLRQDFLIPASRKGVVAKARRDDHLHSGGELVDKSMIVLRMRIKEMKMLESENDQEAPSNWMGWEKEYFTSHYNEDIVGGMGLLQSFLMNTRPSVALGMVALVVLSLPISTSVVLVGAVDFVQRLVSASGIHIV